MLSSLSGVYSAAHDLNVEWIIIKGVSDFADGKNSEKNDGITEDMSNK